MNGSTEVYAALQEGLGSHPELWDKVAISTTGCLGPCFEGPNIVVYPAGVWYSNVKPEDVAEIVESHMVSGVPVARLIYEWPDD